MIYCSDDNQFDCGTNDCIDKKLKCDGKKDCENGADESNCLKKKIEKLNETASLRKSGRYN